MNKIKFHIVGTAPLLMHRGTLVNPLHPLTKQMKEITSKRKKTEEDHLEIIPLELRSGMYHDDKIGPYIPALAVESMLRDAARRNKEGKIYERAVMVDGGYSSKMDGEACKLIYAGPRDIETLISDPNFIDCRNVGISGKRILRSRPRFNSWEIEFSVLYAPEMLNADSVINSVRHAGDYIGLLDYRPKFGRFSVKSFEMM